jgi:hypothetical protein
VGQTDRDNRNRKGRIVTGYWEWVLDTRKEVWRSAGGGMEGGYGMVRH